MLKLFQSKRAPANVHRALAGAELPSFPAVVLAALDKVRDERATSSEIADAVSADPGLSVRLLGTVNSAAYGLRREVRSVHHAVSLLGRSEVEAMLIGLATRDTLSVPACRGFEARRFWTTAARRAVLARALADEVAPARRSECFTAALLEDMAVPLLTEVHGERYGEVLEAWHAGHEELDDHETRTFGWEHAAVGGDLCRAWNFPASIAGAIAEHHHAGPDLDAGLLPVATVAALREENESLGIDRVVRAMHANLEFPVDRARRLLERCFVEAEALGDLFVR